MGTAVSGPTVSGNCKCFPGTETTVRSYSFRADNCKILQFWSGQPSDQSFLNNWHVNWLVGHNNLYNWIYPTSGPDRAHRHKQNCIYPQLFGSKSVLLKIYLAHNILYNWIYPTSGPDRAHRHKHNCKYPQLFARRCDIFNYRVCCVQSIFKK